MGAMTNIYKWIVSFFISCLSIGQFQVLCVDYYTEKPAFLTPCKINEPGFSKCSKNNLQQLVKALSLGIPEVYEKFGPYDPMRIRDIYFDQGNNEVATIKANLTEFIVTGFNETIVKESRVSKKQYTWVTKLFCPKLRLDANYIMSGRILILPLHGSGKMFIEIENVDMMVYTKTRLYEKGGFTFDNITSIRVDMNITNLRTYFDNLFDGQSKEIEKSTNQFFNDNWREVYGALKPIVTESVANVLYDILHFVFNLIPAKFFVEDIPTSEELYGKLKEQN